MTYDNDAEKVDFGYFSCTETFIQTDRRQSCISELLSVFYKKHRAFDDFSNKYFTVLVSFGFKVQNCRSITLCKHFQYFLFGFVSFIICNSVFISFCFDFILDGRHFVFQFCSYLLSMGMCVCVFLNIFLNLLFWQWFVGARHRGRDIQKSLKLILYFS